MNPADLLEQAEAEVPLAVRRVSAFLDKRGVWYKLSRNHPARSCRDAAHKRWRIGHEGIPLHDELKSYFGRMTNGDGTRQYVVAHCRADRLLDLDRLAKALDVVEAPVRLEPEELEGLGLAYGLVNPFSPWSLDGQLLTSALLQVFDDDLLMPVGIPGTVMTNAGDLTWAVELHASALVNSLSLAGTIVADIATHDPDAPDRPPRRRPVIGIVTGNAPESGIALWNRVNNRVREMLGPDNHGDVSMPRVLVQSLPEMGLSMELADRFDPVWAALGPAVHRLCQDGADLIAVACNTTQFFTPAIRDICTAQGAEMVSMPEKVAEWLTARNVSRVGLIGVRWVSDLGPWSAYREPFSRFEVERPNARAMARLDELAYQVKLEGANEAGLTRLRDILRQEIEADHVVLALTELSLLLDRQRKAGRSGKTLIDPLTVYADALAAKFLGLPFPLPDEHERTDA